MADMAPASELEDEGAADGSAAVYLLAERLGLWAGHASMLRRDGALYRVKREPHQLGTIRSPNG
jgi:hypothetical protein